MSLNTPILTVLIAKIKTTLNSVDSVKEVYGYPLSGNPTKSPAVVFFPDSVENDFDTVATNFKSYRFKVIVIIKTDGTTLSSVFENVMPRVIDDILEKFDSGWDYGTIKGHRVWALINNGIWGMSAEEKGKVAWAELSLIIRTSTDN